MKKLAVLISDMLLSVMTVFILSACMPPAPKTIDIADYFEDEIMCYEYYLDDTKEEGYAGNYGQLSLKDMLDSDETNIEKNNYSLFMFTPKETAVKLKIKSISFVFQADSVGILAFHITKGATELLSQNVEIALANAKQIVTFEFLSPITFTTQELAAPTKATYSLSFILENELEAGTIKYSIDSMIVDADVID